MLGKSILQFVDLVTLFLGTMIVAVAMSANSDIGVGIIKPDAKFVFVELIVPRNGNGNGNGNVPVIEWDTTTTSVLVIPSKDSFSVTVSARCYSKKSQTTGSQEEKPIVVKLASWTDSSKIKGTVWSHAKPDGECFKDLSNRISTLVSFPHDKNSKNKNSK